MINGLMRKLGYISEKNLTDVAMEVYERNDTSKASDEKDFYFRSGNANAVGYILGRFGFDVTSLARAKMEVEHERR